MNKAYVYITVFVCIYIYVTFSMLLIKKKKDEIINKFRLTNIPLSNISPNSQVIAINILRIQYWIERTLSRDLINLQIPFMIKD